MIRSLFTNIPMEYYIPKNVQVVFVSDFFQNEVMGGAETTSESLIKKSPLKVFKLHSSSVTKELLENNLDKYWIFGNFTLLKQSIIDLVSTLGQSKELKYSIIEFDFKCCMYRSTQRHQQATGKPCNCSVLEHGLNIQRFFSEAQRIFWMSQGQKEKWLSCSPLTLKEDQDDPHVILSSIFDEETLDFLKTLREERTSAKDLKPKDVWAVLGSGSWIKGIEETQKWCTLNRKKYEPIPNLPYQEFLKVLSRYQGFIFKPLDWDTCPKTFIEAKLLGLNLILNDNVLNKDDDWMTTPEICEDYLRNRTEMFWEIIKKSM